MTEPNMEWEEKEAKSAIIRHTRFFLDTEPTDDFVNVLLGDIKTLARQAISEAETRGYEKGVAEERERLSDLIEGTIRYEHYCESREGEQCEYQEAIGKVLSLIH